jgi:hypothetical protein
MDWNGEILFTMHIAGIQNNRGPDRSLAHPVAGGKGRGLAWYCTVLEAVKSNVQHCLLHKLCRHCTILLLLVLKNTPIKENL